MRYYGFGPWCAAYAFINTTGKENVSPETYELLSGIPFGIKFTMDSPNTCLGPLNEPYTAVDYCAKILGYNAVLKQFAHPSYLVEYVKQLATRTSFMLGPINMKSLRHLPEPFWYNNQSHYIALYKDKTEILLVIDSEGVPAYKYTINELDAIISVKNISEANGLINLWHFEKANDPFDLYDIEHLIIDKATKNLLRAENEYQGSFAIKEFCENIQCILNDKGYIWIYYELNYLLQQKKLFLDFMITTNHYESMRKIVERQIKYLVSMRSSVQNKQLPDCDFLLLLANEEFQLVKEATII
jgi:hypothetical protein